MTDPYRCPITGQTNCPCTWQREKPTTSAAEGRTGRQGEAVGFRGPAAQRAAARRTSARVAELNRLFDALSPLEQRAMDGDR